MQFDPLSELFPLIEGEDFKELVRDIRRNGLRQPIVIYNGKILDGRNRYRACRKAGIEPQFITYGGNDPVGEVISLNVLRRHLTPGQRAIIAAKLANIPRGIQKRNDDGQICPSLMSIADAAKRMDVSPQYVKSAKRLIEESPLYAARVERGELTLNKAIVEAATPHIESLRKETNLLSIGGEMGRMAWRIRQFVKDAPELSENAPESLMHDASNLINACNELIQRYRPTKTTLGVVK